MDEDPEVLAAIEASKQDYMVDDDLEDPLIKAALEESMKDAGGENVKDDDDSNNDNDNKNPENLGEVVTKEQGNAGSEFENDEKSVNDETREDTSSQENCDKKLDVSTSGVTGDIEAKPSSSERQEGAELKTNGHRIEGGTEEHKNVDNETNETDSQPGGEITLEGVPEIQENPFTSEPAVASTTEADPLDDSGANMEEMSELIDQVGPGRSRHTSAGSGKSSLSGIKRKRSSSCSSGDWESNKKKELRPRSKTSKEVLFNCPICTFNSEILGEVNIHKFRSHSAQQKPSYLDIAEIVIAQFDDKAGSKKEIILEEMQKSYSEFLDSPDTHQSSQILSRALTGGVQLGRLRQVGKGYFIGGRDKRRVVYERWKVNKRSVEYKDVKNIAEGSKEFKEIQATLNKLNILVTGSTGAKSKKEESDDEICVVEEKITDKARRRAEHRKKLIAQKRRQLAMQREAAKGGPKTVIKVNSAQGKNLIRKIVATGSVPKQAMKSQAKKSSRVDEDDEDTNLTCPVCLSSFWYPNQTHEHMKNVHNIENPAKYIKEKSSRRR